MFREQLTLIETLKSRNFAISINEVLAGGLFPLIENGLLLTALCNLGNNRSEAVVNGLVQIGIPAVRLVDGFRGIRHTPNLEEVFPYLCNAVNSCPHVAIIMSFSERILYSDLIGCFKAEKFDHQIPALTHFKSIRG